MIVRTDSRTLAVSAEGSGAYPMPLMVRCPSSGRRPFRHGPGGPGGVTLRAVIIADRRVGA
ncbi:MULTISPECIES: hypothetical protein [unclassified Streptomyces]|uniref:hypothetical protein n=1 Tax=unclassified Streptomyces TaxID=2593676 RepID=UPI003423C630